MSLLEKLPTELLDEISDLVATSGSNKLLGFTRASRRLHEIANPVLYKTDKEESGGVASMDHGLKTGLNSVVERSLEVGVNASLRINSSRELERCYSPASQNASFQTSAANSAGLHPSGPDFHYRCYWTPLHVATALGDVSLLELLLHYKANPNSAGIGVCSCYHQSLRRTLGRYHQLDKYEHSPDSSDEVSLDNDNDLSQQNIFIHHQELLERKLVTRWSPLHVAICNGHLKCAEVLISRFGLPHAEDTDDEVQQQAQWFKEADPYLRFPHYGFWRHRMDHLTPRFDPLHPLHIMADKYTSLEAMEKVYSMLKRAGCLASSQPGIDVLDAFGDTPFAVASFSDHPRIPAMWLRDHGANINFIIYDGNQPLSIFSAICTCGLYANAPILMDLGVKINTDNNLYEKANPPPICTILSYFPRDKREDAVALIKTLLHAGANINARTTHGRTALMLAARRPIPATTRALIHLGANVHAVDDNDKTALHHAVDWCMRESPQNRRTNFPTALATIQLLLDHGADPNFHSENDAPPLFTHNYSVDSSVFRYEHLTFEPGPHSMASIAPLMVSKGADPNIYLKHPNRIRAHSLVTSAFYLAESDSLDTLITHGATVTADQYLDMMRSLLNTPRKTKEFSPVDALFKILNRPSLRLQDPGDREHIMKAWEEVLYHAVGRCPALVEDLARHVILTDVRGLGGKNVLHLMAGWKQDPDATTTEFKEQITQVMTQLMKCGAYRMRNEPDDYGKSPLQTAIDLGNTHVAISLVEHGADCYSETDDPDGSTTTSRLKFALSRYPNACFFNTVFKMLATLPKGPEIQRGRYLHDLVLHLNQCSFDHAIYRTTWNIQKLLDLGAGVDGTNGDGNTPLHLLLHLLDGTRDPDTPNCCEIPTGTVNRSAHSNVSFQEHRPRLFGLSEESEYPMHGQNPEDYYIDSPYPMDDESSIWDGDSNSESDADTPEGEESIHSNGSEETLGISSAASPSTGTHPPCQTHEYEEIKIGPGLKENTTGAWIAAFTLLLTRGASLSLRNDAGKTALDYIDELRGRQPHGRSDMYNSVITYLNHFVKRPPFDHELLISLASSDVKVKGSPVLFLRQHDDLGVDKGAAGCAHQSCPRVGCSWLPFW